MDPEAVIPQVAQTREGKGAVMREIAASLHDMCQPLTALQCRLEIGQLFGTPAAYEEAVTEALRESERLLASVQAMRELVRQTLEQFENEVGP